MYLLFLLLFSTEILIDGKHIEIELAKTPAQKAQGLMGRKELPDGHGMLFVYERSQKLSFWMKNTPLPLSIAFFDKDQTLIQILDMEPEDETRRTSFMPALYALEVPQGWFQKEEIKVGAKFSFVVE